MKIYPICVLIGASTIFLAGCISSSHKAKSESTIQPSPSSRVHIMADYVAAEKIISSRYKAQVGKKVMEPSFSPTQLQPSYCSATCDMFVPRQAVVHLKIPKVTTGTVVNSGRGATTRVDVTALSGGFESGTFNTIELQNINKLEFVPQSSSIPLKSNSQVLFNQVRDWQIVDRPKTMPLYRSQDAMLKSVTSAAKPLQAIIKEELRTGSLNQARILGRTEQMLKGKPHDVLSIVGLAPGITYHFRVVNTSISVTETISVEQCNIPVCPADFVQ